MSGQSRPSPRLEWLGVGLAVVVGHLGAALLISIVIARDPSLSAWDFSIINLLVAMPLFPQLLVAGCALGWLAGVQRAIRWPNWTTTVVGVVSACVVVTVTFYLVYTTVACFRPHGMCPGQYLDFLKQFPILDLLRFDNPHFQSYLLSLAIASLGGAATGWLLTRR